MKALSIKLPDPLFHDLAVRAARNSTRQSEIVRAALAAYQQADAGGATASCAQRAQRGVGIVKGPKDLSSNPVHLEGFGR
jgi:hypothetical protein